MIDSFDAVFYTCIFILPGFIIKNIIDSLCPSSQCTDAAHLLYCLLYSVINCAVWSWVYVLVTPVKESSSTLYWLLMVAVTIVGASLLAFTLGIIKQKGYIRLLLNKLGVLVSHSTPTAWEYVFAKSEANWVIITLKDNSSITGLYATSSFASSGDVDQDIYLEKICDPKDPEWIDDPKNHGVYIAKDQIKTIEFM